MLSVQIYIKFAEFIGRYLTLPLTGGIGGGIYISGVGACLVIRFSPTSKFVNKSVLGQKLHRQSGTNDGVEFTNNYK